MATILHFPGRDGREGADSRPAAGQLGEIIIFPGVRIERSAPQELPIGQRALARKRAQRGRKKKA